MVCLCGMLTEQVRLYSHSDVQTPKNAKAVVTTPLIPFDSFSPRRNRIDIYPGHQRRRCRRRRASGRVSGLPGFVGLGLSPCADCKKACYRIPLIKALPACRCATWTPERVATGRVVNHVLFPPRLTITLRMHCLLHGQKRESFQDRQAR